MGGLSDVLEHVRDMGEIGQAALLIARPNHSHDISDYVKDQGTGIPAPRKWLLGIGDGVFPSFLWDHLPIHQVMLDMARLHSRVIAAGIARHASGLEQHLVREKGVAVPVRKCKSIIPICDYL